LWASAPLGASFRVCRPAVGDFGLTTNLFGNLSEALGNFLSELRHFLAQVTELLMDLVPQQRLACRHTCLQARAKCRFHAAHVSAQRA
jgi:hypothetical protein